MSGTTQVVKGRIEEAAGALVGNDRLRTKGRSDQAVGHARQTARQGVQKARGAARKIVEDAKNSAHEAVLKAKRLATAETGSR